METIVINNDAETINDIGYGRCHVEKDGNPFVLEASANILVETYRGHEIRMYTGGKYARKIEYSGSHYTWDLRSYYYQHNRDILITVSEMCFGKVVEERFARIQPPIVNPGILTSLFPRYIRHDYSSGWMASEYTIGKIKEAVAYFKDRIDEQIAAEEEGEAKRQAVVESETAAMEVLVSALGIGNPDGNSGSEREEEGATVEYTGTYVMRKANGKIIVTGRTKYKNFKAVFPIHEVETFLQQTTPDAGGRE